MQWLLQNTCSHDIWILRRAWNMFAWHKLLALQWRLYHGCEADKEWGITLLVPRLGHNAGNPHLYTFIYVSQRFRSSTWKVQIFVAWSICRQRASKSLSEDVLRGDRPCGWGHLRIWRLGWKRRFGFLGRIVHRKPNNDKRVLKLIHPEGLGLSGRQDKV